jgi:hypothetical protein
MFLMGQEWCWQVFTWITNEENDDRIWIFFNYEQLLSVVLLMACSCLLSITHTLCKHLDNFMESFLYLWRKFSQSKTILRCKLNYSYFVLIFIFPNRNRTDNFIYVGLNSKEKYSQMLSTSTFFYRKHKSKVHFNEVYFKKFRTSNLYEIEMCKSSQN